MDVDVGATWDRVEAWLAAHAPGVRASLRPPAGPAAVGDLQALVGSALPADFLASAARHDGQDEAAESGLFPVTGSLGPEPAWRLLAAEEAGRVWGMLNGLLAGGDFAGRTAGPPPGVRADWWHPGWVPVADNGGGDYACLDLAPAAGGTPGQVIVFGHDSGDRPRLAESFGAWLAALADGLAAGRYALAGGDGLVEVGA